MALTPSRGPQAPQAPQALQTLQTFQAPQTLETSSDLDDSDDDCDVFDSNSDISIEVSRNKDWERWVVEAYLAARELDQAFQRALELDKIRRPNEYRIAAQSSSSQIHLVRPPKGPQRRWFLAKEQTPPDGHYYAFETLINGPPLENAPERLSARCRPKNHRTVVGNNTGSAEQLTKSTLQFVANFQAINTGWSTLYLMVKTTDQSTTAVRLLVRILVRYVDTGMSETFYTRFVKRADDDHSDYYYLKAEDHFEIRPHGGIAQANVRITQDEKFSDRQSGEFLIRFLELVPFREGPSHSCPIVCPRVKAKLTLDLHQVADIGIAGRGRENYHGNGDHHNLPSEPVEDGESEDKGIVTRLASSKDGAFFAALTVYERHIKVQVWHKDVIELLSWCKSSVGNVACSGASGDVPYLYGSAFDLPLELAISATGEHVAVYQVPQIGDWQENSNILESRFGVHLFRNPNASRHTTVPSGSNRHHVVNIAGPDSRADSDPDADPLGLADIDGVTEEPAGHDCRPDLYLDHMVKLPANLKKAIGYATFVGEISSGATTIPARFVFCNGLYLDIYELKGDKLQSTNSIPLINMSTALWRTIACELMIRSIASNMFLWIEGNGRYCSTWDLSNGSALGRIDVTGLQIGGPTGDTKMNIACNLSIIAIVGYDNSITTVDASSGITISRRLFTDRIVEGIAFPTPQSQQLVALLRSIDECQQTVLILDPLRLDVQGQAHYVPPLSRSTVFGNLEPKKWPEFGVVCRPDGDKIHLYTCKASTPSIGQRDRDFDELSSSCRYRLQSKALTLRGGQESCKRLIEIWKKRDPSKPKTSDACIFSFIPEPWELHAPAEGKILPTGDRFVVYASWTIQLWSLPTPGEPRCKLLFYWCSTEGGIGSGDTFGKSEIQVILEGHRRFGAAECHQFTGEDQKRFKASIVFSGYQPLDELVDTPAQVAYIPERRRGRDEVVQVLIPSYPLSIADSLGVTENCIRGILLLALTHSIVSNGNQDFQPVVQAGRYEDHASAIIDFVDTHINHSTELHCSKTSQTYSNITLLTYLLGLPRVTDLTANFIASLLKNPECSWIPRNVAEIYPITKAIECRNNVAVRAILDYCVRKAASSHPTYIMPVEHSFKALREVHHELLEDFFKKASYIPAQQVDFNETYVTISTFGWTIGGRRWLSLLFRGAKPKLRDFPAPIITLQLRDMTKSDMRNRAITFETMTRPQAIYIHDDCRVYAVPFRSLIELGEDSQFRLLAGENYFDSPAQLAILSYKWWQYGLFYWIFRYTFLLSFYGIFMAMTFTQMQLSENVESPQDLESLYLGDIWLRLIIVDLALGCALLLFEFIQFWQDWKEGASHYFDTLFNYIDLTSTVFTITCLSKTLNTHFIAERKEGETLQQFSFTIYAIIAMYLHLIVELRVFQHVGIIVNIVVQIMKKIRAFFLVFTLMVIAFTHSMVYLLFVYQKQCKDGSCERPVESDFPYETFPSFATTFFFLAGRYDAVGTDFESKRFDFLLLMVLFYFMCSIVMLTVLIAQVSDAFDDATKDGELAWRRQLSETLLEAEMVGRFLIFLGTKILPMSSLARFLRRHSTFWHDRSQPLPNVIYYIARIQEAEEYKEKLRNKKKE